MDNTPEHPSLECFSSIKSSTNPNISDIPFFADSPEVQKSREEGFSSSILLNLADESGKPASKLINITQIRPGCNPRKLLLPLFFQEFSEIQVRPRRSFSADSAASYVNVKKTADEKKTITTTTINTQSNNVDVIEIHEEMFKDKVNYEYENEVKNSGVNFEMNVFSLNPMLVNCKKCGKSAVSAVERERGEKVFEKIQKAVCCCFGLGVGRENVYVHKCAECGYVIFRLNN